MVVLIGIITASWLNLLTGKPHHYFVLSTTRIAPVSVLMTEPFVMPFGCFVVESIDPGASVLRFSSLAASSPQANAKNNVATKNILVIIACFTPAASNIAPPGTFHSKYPAAPLVRRECADQRSHKFQ